jgi:uncharacterized membrane protein YuzA (DUF378 family)
MTGGKCCAVCQVVSALVTIGALNWGLVGFFQWDLVAQVFGPMSGLSRGVYTVIGIAGVLKVLALFKLCPCQRGSCETKKS